MVGVMYFIKIVVEVVIGKCGYVGVYGIDFDIFDGIGVCDYIYVIDLVVVYVVVFDLLIVELICNYLFNVGYGKGFLVFEVFDVVDCVINMMIDCCLEGCCVGDLVMLIFDNCVIFVMFDWCFVYVDFDGIVCDVFVWECKFVECV